MKLSARIMQGDHEGKSCTIDLDIPERLQDLVRKFGEEVIVHHAAASLKITAQARMRGLMSAGKSPQEIAAAFEKWKPELRAPGKPAAERVRDMIGKMSPEERQSLLAALSGGSISQAQPRKAAGGRRS